MRMRGRARRGGMTLFCVGVASLLALVVPRAESRAEGAPAPAEDPGSPRAAFREFLVAARDADWARAARFLDVRSVPPARRSGNVESVARAVSWALDRTLWVDLDELSPKAEGDRDDGLPASQERVATVDAPGGPFDILLERSFSDGEQRWRMAPSSVVGLLHVYDALGGEQISRHLPAVLRDVRVLEIALWQWIALPLLLALAAALAYAIAQGVGWVARRAGLHEEVTRVELGPVTLIVAVALFRFGRRAMVLALPAEDAFAATERLLWIVALTWAAARAVDIAAARTERALRGSGRVTGAGIVPLGRRTAKLALIGLAAIFGLQNLGFNVTGLLAGLGVGGLAVALAAQKTLENLFGGVTLITDQPVRVGDFCRFGDRVGTVEEIGLRSTRVRTLDRTLVSVPNSQFSSLQLENYAARNAIWFHPTLGLRYETTPDQIRAVLADVRQILLDHPRVSPDPARVRLVGFGAYSLDLEVFAYVQTSDYGEFLEIAEQLMLRIMDAIEANGTGFAFPSQTIYGAGDSGLDADKARAAEARGRALEVTSPTR
jgi:MscS family membrane protein